jgi:hypothetical protein
MMKHDQQPQLMGQFGLTGQLLVSEQQQQQRLLVFGGAQQQQPQQPQPQSSPQKPTRVTKVRRTRQSRNPQLSVARRNERERNRVKMVNKGFALLRSHLPIDYLQQSNGYESAGSETPDIKSPGSQSGKAKKFSKVETLRAAIQHIRMLEELMRSAEPNFESINIGQEQQQPQIKQDDGASNSFTGYDDVDSGPSSCADGPLSCGSASSLINPASNQPAIQCRQQVQLYAGEQAIGASSNLEQFVKLEPFAANNEPIQFQQQQLIQPASPLDSARTTIQTPVSQAQQQHLNSHYSQAPSMMTQVHQQQAIAGSDTTTTSEHTHMWIQQHQSSFMEQQQQQQQQQYTGGSQQEHWSQSYQQQHYVQHQELSPASSMANGSQQYQQQQMQFASQPVQQQLDSPPAGHWFAPSPPSSTIQQQVVSESLSFHAHHQQQQHHQISLYSQ